MPTSTINTTSGITTIDAMIAPTRWQSGTITFNFPLTATYYPVGYLADRVASDAELLGKLSPARAIPPLRRARARQAHQRRQRRGEQPGARLLCSPSVNGPVHVDLRLGNEPAAEASRCRGGRALTAIKGRPSCSGKSGPRRTTWLETADDRSQDVDPDR
mgnify:CR=1 FL=1